MQVSEESVMENVMREKLVQIVDGHVNKTEYLLPVVVHVVMKKVSWRI